MNHDSLRAKPLAVDAQRLADALADRYRIERELGAGGMATVYLARDLKHDRDVAIKVLKPELAAVLGGERFVVEIKTTAALQHPHILPLFDSGEAHGFLYYVMPFVDGETLRAKLDRETQLGVDEAVKIAIDVADALQYAHERGVIHRDIKPENILLANGRPMVADFGIALAVQTAGGGRMTETGLSLGTPHYMSPEQATAEKDITGRSDIYSLAGVLYEMLTGEPPHMGTSAQQIIMKIITEPAALVTKLRKSVPPNVAAAVAKALEKLPADRFENAKSFCEALKTPSFEWGSVAPAPPHSRRPWSIWRTTAIAMTGTSLLLAALLSANVFSRQALPSTRTGVVRFALASEPGFRVETVRSRPFAVSPDGQTIVFRASTDSTAPRLWVRTLGDPHPRPLEGTDGADNASFSPNGEWIASYRNRAIYKVPVAGGPVTRVTAVEAGSAGITWISNDEILFEQLLANGTLPIQRVSAEGGRPTVAIPLDSSAHEIGQRGPLFLSGTGLVAYTSTTASGSRGVVLFRLADGHRAPTGVLGSALGLVDGHLIVGRNDGSMVAVPLDARDMRVTGDSVSLSPRTSRRETGIVVGLSQGGTLVYQAVGSVVPARLDLVDTSGATRSLRGEFTLQGMPRFSPDGRRLVIGTGNDREPGTPFARGTSDLWTIDVATSEPTRLTTDHNGSAPSWSPDGRRILYTAAVGPSSEIRTVAIDGSAPPSRLVAIDGQPMTVEMTPDQHSLITQVLPSTGAALGMGMYRVSLSGAAQVESLLVAKGAGVRPTRARVSPDGRWVAYVDRGVNDVWVRSLRGTTALQVSLTASLGNPVVWSPDSRLLYYDAPEGLVVIELNEDPALSVARRRVLRRLPLNDGYDLSPDGHTFVVVRPAREQADVFVVVNWADDARRAWSKGTKP
jgi:serine/threonine protein kinase/Tol biopolymer transport system component